MAGNLESCIPCDCNFPIAPVGEQGPPGVPGPPGPRGPSGGGGGTGILFSNFDEMSAATMQPSDAGSEMAVEGYYTAGDGGFSSGYLSDAIDVVGTGLVVVSNVVTMTAANHNFVSGDFVSVTGTGVAAWDVTSAAIQYVDANTFRYVGSAATADATSGVLAATISLVTAGIYRSRIPVTDGSFFIYRATSKGVINAQWFGASGNGDTAFASINTIGIRQADEAAWGEQCEWWVPRGKDKYWIDNQLYMREGTTFRNHGYIKCYPDPAAVELTIPGNVFRCLLVGKNEFTIGVADGVGGFSTPGSGFALLFDGLGVLDGSATEVQPVFTPVALPGIAAGTLLYYKTNGGGPQGITFSGCQHILLDCVSVKDAANFAIGFIFCDDIKIRNPNVDTGNGNMFSQTTGIPYKFNGKNQDAIHFTDCWNFEVIGGNLSSSDDQMAATALFATTKNGRWIGVHATHKLAGNQSSVYPGGANDYVALGYGARVSTDAATYRDAHTSDIIYDSCVLEGGNGAFLVRGVPVSRTASSVTHILTVATFNLTAHGFHAGDLIQVSGATPAGYNGSHIIQSVTANSFTYNLAADPLANATGTVVAVGVGFQQKNILFTDCIIKDKTLPGIQEVPGDETGNMLCKRVVEFTGCDNVKMVNCKFVNINREIYISRFTNEPETTNIDIIDNDLKDFGRIEDIIRTATSVTHVTTTATFNLSAAAAAGLVAGEIITVSGANQAAYNGQFTILTLGATSFTYLMLSDPGANATGTVKVTSLKGITSWAIHGISVVGEIDGLRIKNNKVKNTWTGGINIAGNGIVPATMEERSPFKSVDLDGNDLENINNYVFTYDLNSGGSGAILGAIGTDWSITDNKVKDVYGAGIFVYGRVSNLVIGGNKLRNLGRLSYKVGTALTRASSSATFSSVAHGFVAGDFVTISGAQQPEYNGRVQIASAGANSFTYVINSAAEPVATTLTQFRATSTTTGNMSDSYGIVIQGTAGGPGLVNVSSYDNDVFGCDTTAFLMESVDTFDCVRDRATEAGRNGTSVPIFHTFWRTIQYVSTASGVTHSTTTATFTTGNAHRFVNGQKVTISGANEAPYNGTFVITVVSSFVFTYVMLSDPGSNATGTILGTGTVYDFTNVRGMLRHCRAVTNATTQNAFSAAIAGTSPQLPMVLTGVPVVFDNCDFSGPTLNGYNITPNSTDTVVVPLPLGVVRKGSVIGGLYGRACNTGLAAPYDIPIPISNLGNKYRITGIEFRDAGLDMNPQTLVAEIRTVAGGVGGDQLVAAVGVSTLTGGLGVRELVIEPQTLTATAATLVRTGTEIYMRVTTAQAGVMDVVVIGELYE